MITRPGAQPGPAWMRNWGDGVLPRQVRRILLRVFVVFAGLQAAALIVSGISGYQPWDLDRHVYASNSKIQIGGMPLVSIGPVAHGVIAYGGVATGIIAIGGAAAGVVAIGGFSVGIFAAGGLSVGLLAAGALAMGWRAIGGMAIGDAAMGGRAIGRYAYAGNGSALGRNEANGRKERLFG